MGQMHAVTGGGGIPIAVGEWGQPSGPAILFIHGYCQSHLTWLHQLEGPLAGGFRLVAMDLRGHGSSGAPAALADFADGKQWAGDVDAVIRELRLDRPVLVGWSYGGFLLADFVRHFGQERVAGLHFVAALPRMGDREAGALIGPALHELGRPLVSEDLRERIEATRSFVHRLSRKPLPSEELERAVAYNMVVAPDVRRAVLARRIQNDDIFSALRVPTLVSHGRADETVLFAAGEYIAAIAPGARLSAYDDVGHVPFLEERDRFDRELAEFARSATA